MWTRSFGVTDRSTPHILGTRAMELQVLCLEWAKSHDINKNLIKQIPSLPSKNWADSRFMAPQNRKLFILTWEMGNKMQTCACLNPATDNSPIKRIDDFTSVLRCAELMESTKRSRVGMRIVRLVHSNLMFIGPYFIVIVEEWKTNLMSLAILFHFLCAQHVSNINISIIYLS